MKPKVLLSPGIIVIYGGVLDFDEHKHNAIQIVWPESECALELKDSLITSPVVIGAQVDHKLAMKSGVIVLAEPQSDLGDVLVAFLQGNEYVEIKGLPPLALTEDGSSQSPDFPLEPLPPLWNVLNLQWNGSLMGHHTSHHLDKRIARLQTKLNTCFSDESMKTSNWKASEVASGLMLSEGRFLHLFRQEMGIAWRPYLLWRRLLCAASLLSKGCTATYAAQASGFSDNAHLSRTFRKTFGITVREAVAVFC